MQLHSLCCNQNNDDVIKISFLPVREREVLVDIKTHDKKVDKRYNS